MSRGDVDATLDRLRDEAEASGYHLNPDMEFTRELVEGLVINTDRYGYPSCPCRLAEGSREGDLDIICPCDYRDPDLLEHGCCYCALYVSDAVVRGEATAASIPERRPPIDERRNPVAEGSSGTTRSDLSFPVWRCSVCGYLCAREEPPEKCPVCKVDQDRFRRFM